jgi:NADH:ubiquinone oxidoreductase subunit B-like Fe-S oxidoreductase
MTLDQLHKLDVVTLDTKKSLWWAHFNAVYCNKLEMMERINTARKGRDLLKF